MSLLKFNRKGKSSRNGKTPDGRSDRIYGFKKYKVGDYVSEDDLESKFKLKGDNPKNYPQLSVQDYSTVKKDKLGRKYVEHLND
tara:strand:+ start:10 stop:261 length:252 start_codon:yes stop_codon:yes gene_type:complete